MKKILSLLVGMTLSISFLSAQNAYRAAGDMSIEAGAGYGTLGFGVQVNFDYTVFDFGSAGNLSFGGYVGDSMEQSTHCMLVGPMVSYRFPISESFELSARSVLGYGLVFNEYAHAGRFGEAFFAGATYYISDRIGIGGELCYGVAPTVSAHIAIRL
jgi:hypothetical protein